MGNPVGLAALSSKPFVSRSEGQTLLIGPRFFLRPVEPDDATTAAHWHPNPLPAPVEVLRERIERELGSDPDAEAARQRLLICRRCDDRPLGSVLFAYENERACTLRFSHDRNHSPDQRAAIEAEVMRFALPFLIDQRRLMKVTTDHTGDHPIVREAAMSLGMRRCYRLREAVRFRDRRCDRIGYELLNPTWIRLLGMPRGMTEGPVERVVRAPAPLLWSPNGEVSPQVVATGHRIELRPFEPGDGALATHWFLREQEDFYPQGPPLRNPWTYGQRMAAIARQGMPDQIRLAIVESCSGQALGMIGVAQLDLYQRRGKTTFEIFQPAYRGKGYGTEAMHLLLGYLFDRLGLHMVYAWVSEFNRRSLAALRKQGYREAGYFAWEDLSDDGFTGGIYLDLLASEWRAARAEIGNRK
jgi:RimJ/RimL family protein N-acetyltransferase